MTLQFEIDQRAICVFCQIDDGGTHRAFGTGFFFMKNNLIATAKHVVEDVVASQRPTYVMNGKGKGAKPEECWNHPYVDLALVKCASKDLNAPDVPLFPAGFQFNRGGGCVGVGYSKLKSDTKNRIWAAEAFHIKTFNELRRDRANSIEWTIEFENDWMEGGCSGGPILSAGGGVIAVLIESATQNAPGNSPSNVRTGRATSIYPLVDCFSSPF
jgi:hypothetical protein